MSLLTNLFDLFVVAAPWLVFGYTVAALIKQFVPADLMASKLGGTDAKTTVRAALIGAPLPLCSCGVIPAALGLRRAGASKNATTAFLVATPETGVDSVAVSYAMLGPVMAVIRPVAAITSAICAGLLVGRSEDSELQAASAATAASKSCCASKASASKATASNVDAVKAESSCCSSKSKPEVVTAEPPATSCCASENKAAAKPSSGGCCSSKAKAPTTPGLVERIRQVLRYAFVDMVGDTYRWLLIGLFFAAIVQTYVPQQWLTEWGQGPAALLIMAVIGVPMYICATASTPVAAGFLLAGISPGAVLVFMLAGPATNIATIGLVKKELGNRALAAYLGGDIGVSLLFGLLLNWLVEHFGWEIVPTLSHDHQHAAISLLVWAATALLAGAMLNAFYQKQLKPFKQRLA
ncbi:SO_0444 family Cu/Zn efflux transporter [Aliagarivorans taiwanensis]|uniref:SO_0444 family Cu/Zn efflux transporter n=1 Tax=Aliagarivorans taiwanensis TaxID=561966 RepID=UPI00040D98E7|nr:SO_0444 family Cu/Zn efflux transporter [Aliagarivorans taiwanensis]